MPWLARGILVEVHGEDPDESTFPPGGPWRGGGAGGAGSARTRARCNPVDLAVARGLANEGVDATALSVLLARSLMALVAADEEEDQVPQVPLVEGG